MPINYISFATVMDEESHVSANITYRIGDRGHKLYSFSLGRDYVTPTGEKGRTPWLQRRHIAALRKLLDKIEERMKADEVWAKEEAEK